jgi:hypothetical protein
MDGVSGISKDEREKFAWVQNVRRRCDCSEQTPGFGGASNHPVGPEVHNISNVME